MKTFATIDAGLGGSALGLCKLGYAHLWGASWNGADGSVYSNLLGSPSRFAVVYVLPKDGFDAYWRGVGADMRPGTLVAHIRPDADSGVAIEDKAEAIISAVKVLEPSRVIVISSLSRTAKEAAEEVKEFLQVSHVAHSQKIRPADYGIPCSEGYGVTRAIRRMEGGLSVIRPTAAVSRDTDSKESRGFLRERGVDVDGRIVRAEQFFAAQTFPTDGASRLTACQKRHSRNRIRQEFPPELMRVIERSFHEIAIGSEALSW